MAQKETPTVSKPAAMKVVLISGRSGSGKSVALKSAEDLGYYCVDNLPVDLLEVLLAKLEQQHPMIAIGIDVRSGFSSLDEIVALRESLQAKGWQVQLIYLDADNATLLKRFSETRRRHPLTHSGISLNEAIDKERVLLEPLALAADLVIDTSRLSSKDLRRRIHDRLANSAESGLDLLFESFGFKNGIPADANYVFDARCLPNPYWVESLRDLTGLDAPVQQFFAQEPSVAEFIWQVKIFLHTWLPRFEEEHRQYLTVAIGCTGGQHRSVYMAEALANEFRESLRRVNVRHRDLRIKNA